MKKMLITIYLLSILVLGCNAISGKAWYNPKIPVYQAVRDYEDCDCISYKHGWFGVSQFDKDLLLKCMNSKGYKLHETSQLRKDSQIWIKPNLTNAGWSPLAFEYPIAGKIK